jgi:hypothetical protein
MGKGQSRPRIPHQTEIELWARTAGRCEFRGCNERVYLDPLTKKHSNLGPISHIVAFSPDGPRGDPILSKKLETDIGNLMLTCRVHAKIIDDKDKVSDYPVEFLLEFKREHEERIRMLTEAKDAAQTHVLLFQAAIDGHSVAIDQTAAFRAILPKYPADEEAWKIDLGDLVVSLDQEGAFELLAQAVTTQVGKLLGPRQVTNLSVFALGPVPLLVHLGQQLGDLQHVDLYQRHRDKQDWAWKSDEEADSFYEVVKPDITEGTNPRIALVLAISANITREQVEETLGTGALIYEIRAITPERDFLRSRKRLEVFGWEVRKLLDLLHDRHHHDETVHVLQALPAPMAVDFGRYVKKLHQPMLVYEYQKATRRFTPALTINHRSTVAR